MMGPAWLGSHCSCRRRRWRSPHAGRPWRVPHQAPRPGPPQVRWPGWPGFPWRARQMRAPRMAGCEGRPGPRSPQARTLRRSVPRREGRSPRLGKLQNPAGATGKGRPSGNEATPRHRRQQAGDDIHSTGVKRQRIWSLVIGHWVCWFRRDPCDKVRCHPAPANYNSIGQ